MQTRKKKKKAFILSARGISTPRVDKYLRLREGEVAQRLLLHVLPESDLVQRLGHPVPVQHLAETQGLVMHLRGRAFIRVGRQWTFPPAGGTLRGYLPDPDNWRGRSRERLILWGQKSPRQLNNSEAGGWNPVQNCFGAAFLTLCSRRGSSFFFSCHGTAALAAKTEVAGMRISISNLPMSPGQPGKVDVGGRGSRLPSLGWTHVSSRWHQRHCVGEKKSLLPRTKRKHIAPGNCDCSCRLFFCAR